MVGGVLASEGNCYSVPAPSIMALHLRYMAGEIDLVQLLDETKRQLRHPEAPAADVRLLLPEQPGQAYPYAAEMAQMLYELAQLPLPQPYLVEVAEIPAVAAE